MMTPTHVLIGAAAFARPGDRRRNLAAIFGALLPDLSIFVLFGWGRFVKGVSEHQLWRELYWQEPWQTLGAISNSAPLYAGLLLLGWWRAWPLVWVLGGAALLHVACDLPLHALDAHVHFWPFTDWRFHSPLSYWDNSFHGAIVRVFEGTFAVILIGLLAWRFKSVGVRLLLALALLSYVGVPLYFRLMLH